MPTDQKNEDPQERGIDQGRPEPPPEPQGEDEPQCEQPEPVSGAVHGGYRQPAALVLTELAGRQERRAKAMKTLAKCINHALELGSITKDDESALWELIWDAFGGHGGLR